MLIKRKTDYAIRSILYLSQKKNKIVDVNEIAREKFIPSNFLTKILQRLKKKGIIKSFKGKNGGFYLLKNPREINILEIIEIMQGPISLNLCAVDKRKCKLSNVCSLHPLWLEMRKNIERELKRVNFYELMKDYYKRR
ncbi:MAG: Rrf2 family transcriptional regulator [Candidatus Hydrothermales bacterium]